MEEQQNFAHPDFIPGEHAMEQTTELLRKTRRKDVLGVALVGLGNYSTTQLGPALLETKCCRLAGIVTGSKEKAEEWKVKYAIPETNIYNYSNFDDIKDNADIDIVYIVLPNAMHCEFTERAARAGKHVICEKPMAISVEECDRMIKACADAGKQLGIGYRLHYEPHNMEAMKIGQEKIFGSIHSMHAQFGTADIKGWRLDKKLAGGGALMDLGIYCIQAARYVSGHEPGEVNAGKVEMNENGVELAIDFELNFPGGLTAKCEAAYNKEMDLFHATAEHGWLELSPAFEYEGIKAKTATGFLTLPSVNQQALELDDFALSVLENRPAKLPGDLGRKDLVLIKAIYESLSSGKPVSVKQ